MILTNLKRTAHHEAGHAVMAMALGGYVDAIEIQNDGKGHANLSRPLGDSALDRIRRILLAASGLAAEMHLCEQRGIAAQSGSVGHFNDQEAAEADLRALGQDGKFVGFAILTAKILARPEYWKFVSSLGWLLEQCPRIDNRETLRGIAAQVPPLNHDELERVLGVVTMFPKDNQW